MPQSAASSAALLPQPEQAQRDPVKALAGCAVFAALFLAALTWAKWIPYMGKLGDAWSTHSWSGKNLLANAGSAGSAPSLEGAWSFMRAYIEAIWPAIVAALLIGAGVQAILPRRVLLAPTRCGGELRQSLVGGVASLPTLMCTCCTAPVAVSLRRQGVPRPTALAYWIGNPVLNPAVLAFLALVGPWQWAVTRVLAGSLLVFGATTLVARLAAGPEVDTPPAPQEDRWQLGGVGARYGAALLRLAVTLLPEYVLVLFLLGLFRGWAFPFDVGTAQLGVLAVLIAAVLGTLMVIPTAGEIPIVQGLAALGVGSGAIGALLITLPAISLVSMAMVVRTFSVRVTLAMAAAVAICGMLAGALLWALSG